MDERSTTERSEGEDVTLESGKRVRLPEKLSLLRQKLGQKAKQGRATPCECLRRRPRESRMREICTSGSMRGE